MAFVGDSKIVKPENKINGVSGNIKPLGSIEPLDDMNNSIPPLIDNIPDPESPHMQTLYRDIPDPHIPHLQDDHCSEKQQMGDAIADNNPQSESVINTQSPDNILSESVNSERHDPYRTIHLKDNPVEPKINKNTDGIGGDRKEENPLKDEGELTQTGIQKKFVGANPNRKDSEFPLHEQQKHSLPEKANEWFARQKELENQKIPKMPQRNNPQKIDTSNAKGMQVKPSTQKKGKINIINGDTTNPFTRNNTKEAIRKRGNAKVTIGYSKTKY